MKFVLAMAALVFCFTAVSRAASPPPLPAGLLACSKLRNPAKRLSCYDTQIGAVKHASVARSEPATAQPPHPSRTVTRPAAPRQAQPSPAQQDARFGAEFLPPSEQPPAPPRMMILRSTITKKIEAAPDAYFLSLANGQVWRQNGGSRVLYFFHVGDKISIERTTFGGYHMWDNAVGAKNWIRVIRVR